MNKLLRDIDVFILCGGFGKRLGNICRNNPKPMVKIGDRPFLNIVINYMADFGFRRFILGIGYKADVVEDYYGNKWSPNLDILFSREKVPLDTGGAVKKARELIRSNPFFVLNGDSFCKFNSLRFLSFHQHKKSFVSILLKKVSDGKEYGEVKINKDSRILSFNEKNSNSCGALINAGVYIFDKKIFSLFPNKKFFSLEYDFFPKIIPRGIFGYVTAGFFIDIGTPQRLQQAKKRKELLDV